MYNCKAMHGVCRRKEYHVWLLPCVVFLWNISLNGGMETMEWNLVFVVQSVMLGVGLAMDAFSVSLANGLNEPDMKRKRICLIAGVFGLFQAIMPLTGWFCVHNLIRFFAVFEKCIPWIALILLAFIGGKMIREGLQNKDEVEKNEEVLGFKMLLLQGIATSIDALSVGFTISEYEFIMALACALIIAAVTFVICVAGVKIGKKFGMKLAGKASVLGGVILLGIGIEIFVTGIF